MCGLNVTQFCEKPRHFELQHEQKKKQKEAKRCYGNDSRHECSVPTPTITWTRMQVCVLFVSAKQITQRTIVYTGPKTYVMYHKRFLYRNQGPNPSNRRGYTKCSVPPISLHPKPNMHSQLQQRCPVSSERNGHKHNYNL